MIAVATELPQQHVEPLGLRHEDRGTHVLADIEPLAHLRDVQAQQILREQDANDVVAVIVHHGKARVPGLDDHREQTRGRLVAVHEHHLCTRNHDVAHLQIGDLQHALEHGQRIGIDQTALARFAQQGEQILAILRLRGEALGQPLQPASG